MTYAIVYHCTIIRNVIFTTIEIVHHDFGVYLKVQLPNWRSRSHRSVNNNPKASCGSTSRRGANHYVLANTNSRPSSRMHMLVPTLFSACTKEASTIHLYLSGLSLCHCNSTLNVRLSNCVVRNNLGIHPVGEERSCSLINCLSWFDDVISYLIFPIFPNAPKVHTKDMLLQPIKVLQNNKHIWSEL